MPASKRGRGERCGTLTHRGPGCGWHVLGPAHGYHYFSSSVSFCRIADSFSSIAQRVTSVDDGCDLSGRKKIHQKSQILLVDLRHEGNHLLAPNPRQQGSQYQTLEHLSPAAPSGHDTDPVLAQRAPVVEDRMIG